MRNRDEAIKKYGHLYTVFRQDRYGVEFFKCFYCGDPADQIDHQPPITRVSDYRSLGLVHELYISVPCCAECNQLLNDELTADLLEREVVLKDRLAKKYRRVLRSRTWTPEDIQDAEIVGNLKKFVRGHARRKRRIEDRVDYAGGIRAFLSWLRVENRTLDSREDAA